MLFPFFSFEFCGKPSLMPTFTWNPGSLFGCNDCHPKGHCVISLLQATASCFIDRLSEEYGSYVDIIQPIQVAIYEMKLGLALLLSSALQKDFLGRMQENKVDQILVLDAFPLMITFFFCFL